jgi:hypothetical protein
LTFASVLATVLSLSGWDLALILAVSVQATALAYVPDPRVKAFLLTLPIPFTFASLALGLPVSTSNVLGLPLLLAYAYGVYLLRLRLRLPIVLAIAICAVGYCLVGAAAAPWLPTSDLAFWSLAVSVFALGAVLYRLMPYRPEPPHSSPLPIYLKFPLIALVILSLVLLKKYLLGFMTLFPMVGVVASYEGRYCLWTLTRQMPVVMMSLLPLMATARLLHPLVGLGWSLAAGWVVFLAVLVPITRAQRREAEADADAP